MIVIDHGRSVQYLATPPKNPQNLGGWNPSHEKWCLDGDEIWVFTHGPSPPGVLHSQPAGHCAGPGLSDDHCAGGEVWGQYGHA